MAWYGHDSIFCWYPETILIDTGHGYQYKWHGEHIESWHDSESERKNVMNIYRRHDQVKPETAFQFRMWILTFL